MKILFVCHRVPYPPKRGGKIRPFNIIRHLTEKGHQVTVASLARSSNELREASGLKQYCSALLLEVIPDWMAWLKMILWIATPRPSSFAYFHSRKLKSRIAHELNQGNYDLIFVHCSSMAAYVQNEKNVFKSLDYGDMDSQKWREYAAHRTWPFSLGFWLEAVKLERTERLISKKFDFVTCTTKAELDTLRSLGINTHSDWFPNGVDTDYFQPSTGNYDTDLVVFVGRMDYFPNQQAVNYFCYEVLPVLRQHRPSLRFQIVGADPTQQIRDLSKLPGVSVTGSVPDVRAYVTNAALTVAPLTIARGTQNKILESMSMGVPVVCSRAASGGIDAIVGEHVLVADSVMDYVMHITSLLDFPLLRQRLSEAGRARMLARHTWTSSMKHLDVLLADQI